MDTSAILGQHSPPHLTPFVPLSVNTFTKLNFRIEVFLKPWFPTPIKQYYFKTLTVTWMNGMAEH